MHPRPEREVELIRREGDQRQDRLEGIGKVAYRQQVPQQLRRHRGLRRLGTLRQALDLVQQRVFQQQRVLYRVADLALSDVLGVVFAELAEGGVCGVEVREGAQVAD